MEEGEKRKGRIKKLFLKPYHPFQTKAFKTGFWKDNCNKVTKVTGVILDFNRQVTVLNLILSGSLLSDAVCFLRLEHFRANM